jgi:hypothetical protein
MNKMELLNEIRGTRFEMDLSKGLMVNNGRTSLGIWNLIISIRDCKLYSVGLKPNRHWKISDVKQYFGVRGNAKDIAKKLEEYKGILLP